MKASSLLLGPDARRLILARTFLDPEREIHLRELARLTRLAPRTVQQEIDKLVAADLLRERRDGNRRYLRANDHHPLYRPVREILLKTEGLADVLRSALESGTVQFAVVFGSVAAGITTAASDVDLLIVGQMGLREAVRRLAPAHDELGRVINPIVWTPEEFVQRRRTDPFAVRLLAGPLISVIGEVPQ